MNGKPLHEYIVTVEPLPDGLWRLMVIPVDEQQIGDPPIVRIGTHVQIAAVKRRLDEMAKYTIPFLYS